MRPAMHHGPTGARRLRTMMALSLLVLVPGPGSAGSSSSAEEDASLRREWEKVRANQERTMRERSAAASASVKGGGRGHLLARTAETAGRDGGAVAGLYSAQNEYLDRAMGEWEAGAERKNLQTAISLLQRNMERSQAHLARASKGAQEMSTQLGQSGVLDKVLQIETAAKEAGERLSARWERERAAREREREQREREAGERAREQRR